MKRLLLIPALMGLAAVSGAVTPEKIADQIQMKLRSLHSLQAEYEHYYFSMTASEPLKETGRFFFMKPDWMRWDSVEPEKQTFLYKDGLFLFYIPEENQLIRRRNSKEKYESEILALFSGSKNLRDAYIIESNPFPTENGRALQVKLTPRQEGEYTYILLETDSRDWLIRKAVFFDWAGNKQEFRFSRIKIDPRLSQESFHLKIPPGCEIIEDGGDSRS